MPKNTSKDPGSDIGSRTMPNPVIKASVAEGMYQRLEEEAERLGITVPELTRFALIAALESPRRMEDVIAVQERLAAIEKRLTVLEKRTK